MVEIKNLSFSYHKSKKVLDDVSFDILDNKVTILLGPNGVGKSTIINCLLGFNKVKEGSILVDSIPHNKLSTSEKAKSFAYVAQSISKTDLTVEETILLGRLPFYKIYPSKEDKILVDDIIKELSLEEIRFSNTNEISGGERQKVAIATSLVQDAKTIVFDEPTSNLDIKSQVEILNMIKYQVSKKQKSALISMHDINQALEIGDRFIFLKDGKVYKTCTKEEIDASLLKDVYGIKMKIIQDKKEIYVHYEK